MESMTVLLLCHTLRFTQHYLPGSPELHCLLGTPSLTLHFVLGTPHTMNSYDSALQTALPTLVLVLSEQQHNLFGQPAKTLPKFHKRDAHFLSCFRHIFVSRTYVPQRGVNAHEFMQKHNISQRSGNRNLKRFWALVFAGKRQSLILFFFLFTLRQGAERLLFERQRLILVFGSSPRTEVGPEKKAKYFQKNKFRETLSQKKTTEKSTF